MIAEWACDCSDSKRRIASADFPKYHEQRQ
jgi:hypothetical protein